MRRNRYTTNAGRLESPLRALAISDYAFVSLHYALPTPRTAVGGTANCSGQARGHRHNFSRLPPSHLKGVEVRNSMEVTAQASAWEQIPKLAAHTDNI